MAANEDSPPLNALRDGFWLGPWLVQPNRNLISGKGSDTRIEPMIMQVLLCLARSPGETLSPHAFNREVWEGRTVSDKVLTRAISTLRKAFGDEARNPRFIETVSKTGYRLLVAPKFSEAKVFSVGEREGRGFEYTPRVFWKLMIPGFLVLVLCLWLFRNFQFQDKHEPLLSPIPSRPLTAYPGHELRPRISPAGDRVIFSWKGLEDDNWDIYLQHVSNGKPHRLTHHADSELSPVWSPDGSRIAYFRFGEKSCGIYLQEVPGGSPQKVNDCFAIPSQQIEFVAPKIAWSPDGDSLAYTASRGGANEPLAIVLYSLASGEFKQVTRPPAGIFGDLDPAFSPDGRSLAVNRIRNWTDRDLFVVDLETSRERQLTFDHRVVLGHDWTRDGANVVFSSNRNGTYGLWMVTIDDKTLQWLPAQGGYLKYPSLARENSAWVYENWQYDTNIWWIPAEQSRPPEMRIASTRWDFQPDFCDANNRVAFVSNRSGSFEIWTSDLQGKQTRQITHLEAGNLGPPRWSPDGKGLLFHQWRNGRASLYLWQRGEGPPKPLLPADGNSLFGGWSSDGKWIFFISDRGSGWQLWRVPVRGGEPALVTRQEAFYAVSAAEGSHLIFMGPNDARVWQIPILGGEPNLLFTLDSPGDWGTLAAVKDGLYFVRRNEAFLPSLAFYHLGTGSVEHLRALESNLPVHEISLTAEKNGAWILLTRVDRTESDIHLVPNLKNLKAFFPRP